MIYLSFYASKIQRALRCALAVVITLVGAGTASAQIGLTYGESVEDLAARIAGDGVQILNPVITCHDSAYGSFDIPAELNFPVQKGVILSTGNINSLIGPNNTEAHTTAWNTPGDPQITLLGGQTSFDACALEFDVVPAGDTLRFNFTFASEEYDEYVGTPFNDIFAFFISGPGIVGDPGMNGMENIAVIPNTNTPVGISTVNNGNPDIGFPAQNNEYFVENPPSMTAPFQFDGWTKGLYAEKIVQPCDTFRLKLVIADVADNEWDSSVLIEGIESNTVTLASATLEGLQSVIEGCNPGTVTFTRSPVTDQPLQVSFFVQGTAQNGVDFDQIGDDPDPEVPKFITIPANEASVTIDIIAIDDGLAEGEEYIDFYLGNPLCPGTVSDSLRVVILDELEVAVNPPLSFVCLGDDITFSVTGDDAATYSWSPTDYLDDPNIKEPTTTPLADITYTVTATAGACSNTATVEVQVSDVTLTADVTDVLCEGETTGAIDLHLSGGQSPYDVEWTGPNGFTSDQEDISDLEPGTYNVLVSDRDGCTATLSIEVGEVAAMELELTSPTFPGGDNISCFGLSDGQATVEVLSGGTAPYTYLWDDADATTDATVTGLPAGTYTVTVTDANGCEMSADITLTAPDAVTAVLTDRTNILCHGGSEGSATISPQGGNGPYSITWNTVPPQFGTEITGLSAGFYTASITDVNGCQGTFEVEIEQPANPLGGTVSVVNPTCSGDEDATATAFIAGGTPPYSYEWSAQPGVDTDHITGLATGNYQLTVTDANGCTFSIPFNVNAPLPLGIDIVDEIHPGCHGAEDGFLSVEAHGGTGPYTYTWNTTPATDGPILSGLGAGSYTVTVEDANGCVESLTIDLIEPAELTLSVVNLTEPDCHGDTDGSIEVEADGGTAPYTYSWNTTPPTAGETLSGVGAGTYTVTVTDDAGCTAQLDVVVEEPEALEITVASIQHVLCAGESNGEVTLEIEGGIEPYDVTWDDPAAQTGLTATNLAAGTYIATVVDGSGCTAQLTVTITEPTDPLGGNIVSISHVGCFGDDSGSATVEGTGGSGSYSYSWDDPNNQQTSTATGLAPGIYNVTITDNNGCSTPVVLQVEIEGPTDALELTLTPSVFGGGHNVACATDSTATIDLEITGGTAPYDILWDLPGLETSTDEDLSDLPPGVYSVTVTDANGCEATETIELTAPTPISITFETTPSLCFGLPQGSLSIEIFGGIEPYDVLWNGPNGFTSTDLELEDIEGGIYNLTITDANGCEYLDAVTVTQPDDLVITVDSISDYNGFNTTCYNSHDGAVFITPSGGTPPYSHQWNSPGNPNFSNQEDVINLGPGTYETVLIDQNGCVQNEFIDIVAPDTIGVDFTASIYPNGFNISCKGANDGSLDASGTGGTPPYTYIWAGPPGFGPVFGNPITDLGPGEYSVVVMDANNCVFSATTTLTEPPGFTMNLIAETYNGSHISCPGESDGAINLILSGNAGPYDISWTGPDGFTSTDEDLFNLPAGEYCVTVIDANDCEQTACILLEDPEPLAISLSGIDETCAGDEDGSIDATVTGGSGAYTYEWTGENNFTATTEDLTGLSAGTYCLIVTDANGCKKRTCITINSLVGPEIVLENSTDALCFMDNSATIDITVNTAEPSYTVSWTGPYGFVSTDEDLTGLFAGTYCVTVDDGSGCVAQQCFTVGEAPELSGAGVRTSYNGFHIDCHGNDNGGIWATGIGGTPPYTYSWIGPDGFTSTDSLLLDLAPGIYCGTVTDSHGCTYTQCTQILEPPVLEMDPDVVLPECGSTGETASVTLNVSGGVPPYTYNWSTGDQTESVELDYGTHTVIVSDANGCEMTEVFEIEFSESLVVGLESPLLNGGVHIACHGGTTGEITLTVYQSNGNTTYSWTGPNGFVSTDKDLSGLVAGQYCVTVTDESDCEVVECITLTEPEVLEIEVAVTDALCDGSATGSLSASTEGGMGSITYSWTGPNGYTATGAEIDGLEAGTYCVTATDVNGCSVTTCEDVEAPQALSVTLDSPLGPDGYHIECFGDDSGEITAEITGGTSPYTYSWTGPNGFESTAEDLSDLIAGEYCLTATDANGCESTVCITLTEAPGMDITLTPFLHPNGFHVTCNADCDGSIEGEILGGAEPLVIEWEGPGGFTSDQLDISGLCAGVYVLTVTDADGCSQSTSVTLEAPAAIAIDLSSPQFNGGHEVGCFGDSSGSIDTEVSGGTGSYTYSWTGPDGFTSSDVVLDNLPAGTYTLEIEDSDGCTATATIELHQPDAPLTAEATSPTHPSGDHISCHGANDGSIEVEPAGGTPPYAYNWNGPNGFTSDSQNPQNLSPGEYTLVIEDANSCVTTVVVTLTEPDAPLSATLTAEEILCAGDENGALEVEGSGGSGALTISWIGPDAFSSTEFSIDGLAPGTYTYLLEDINGCSLGGSYTLEAPAPIVITGTTVPSGCEDAIGQVDVTIQGGTPPYEVLWDNGATTTDLTNVPAGEYNINVTDANGCMATATFEVESINDLEIDFAGEEPGCYGESSGTLEAIVTGGQEPIEYAWTGPNGFTATGAELEGIPAGEYTVTATAANGCDITGTYVLDQPDSLYISELFSPLHGNGHHVSTFQGNDGIIFEPEITGGTQPYTLFYEADNGYTSTGFGDKGGLEAGYYTVVVLDAHLCEDTARIRLTEPVPIELPNGISPNGDGFNDYLHVRGLEGFPVNHLMVFNRWGNKVYEEKNYRNSNPWYGTNEDGDEIPEGTYFVIVELEGHDTLKGYLEVRR